MFAGGVAGVVRAGHWSSHPGLFQPIPAGTVCSLGTTVFPADQHGLAAPPCLTHCPALAPDPCPGKGFQRWPEQALAALAAPGPVQERELV